MKSLFFSLLLMLLALGCQAQIWHTDFAAAKAAAQAEQKPILMVFQGSDWCAPCIKLDREIWHSDVFKIFAEKDLILVKVDFPRRKKNRLTEAQEKHNAQLAEQYNREGSFPLVVMLDAEGKVLGKTGYKKVDAPEYIDMLYSFIPKP